MRIQHNIMAMNAYRNYTNNVSAMKSNLEKLSSGYKINRAGDDAAGLAISEKMRAQITGLETAQKNAKDGISLVQTAEGALTEVHDMLNRMVELANQSANGTYDNETDRYQLQKELNQLREEIDRIADSSNFNGINLLDGSMDAESDLSTKVNFNVGGVLPGVGQILGKDTVLHNEGAGSGKGTDFGVAMHDYTFSDQEGDSMSMTISGGSDDNPWTTTITLTRKTANASTDSIDGTDIVAKILAGSTTDYDVTVDGIAYNAGDKIKINGQDVTLSQGEKDYTLQFTQEKAPTSEAEEINGSLKVTLSGVESGKKAIFEMDLTDAISAAASVSTGGQISIDGVTVAISASTTDNLETILTNSGMDAFVEAFKEKGYDVEVSENKVTLTATEEAAKDTPIVNVTSGATSLKGTTVTGSVQAYGEISVAVSGVNPATNATGIKLYVRGAKTDGTGLTNYVSVTTSTIQNANHGSFTAYSQVEPGGTVASFNVEWTYTPKYPDAASTDPLSGEGTLTFKVTGTDGSGEKLRLMYGAGSSTNDITSNCFVELETKEQKAQLTYDISGWSSGGVLRIGNGTSSDAMIDFDDATQVAALKSEDGLIVKGGTATKPEEFVAKINSDGKLVIEEKTATNGRKLTTTQVKVSLSSKLDIDVEPTPVQEGKAGKTANANGDYNVSTVDINAVTAAGSHRLASTYFDLTDAMVEEGSELRIGDATYVFTNGKTVPDGATTGAIAVDISSGDLDTIAKKLTDAAYQNDLYTVGHDGSRITLTETVEHDREVVHPANASGAKIKWDLSTAEGIEKSLGFTGAKKTGNGLVLQIGDTADSFNQLRVNIRDAHCAALGIDSISIADQKSASDAVEVIKAAINQVSDIRGTLGATQNRLDHTINNLSVMTENIQDAESTIRDVDVAEEMMAYTKNNILIQSAQAMLAQANQVPQGVLQLLQ